jgi:hypothetical protein
MYTETPVSSLTCIFELFFQSVNDGVDLINIHTCIASYLIVFSSFKSIQ